MLQMFMSRAEITNAGELTWLSLYFQQRDQDKLWSLAPSTIVVIYRSSMIDTNKKRIIVPQ
jgi:hypothetical protein